MDEVQPLLTHNADPLTRL